MAEVAIPVDLRNPGQVFACLGFQEAAELLVSATESRFDWSEEPAARFVLRTEGQENPFRTVLAFLAAAEPRRWAPDGYTDPPPKKKGSGDDDEDDVAEDLVVDGPELSGSFMAPEGNRMALPIRFGGGNQPTVELSHWADGSSRNDFKLYAGNRSALGIARAMLCGTRDKPKKGQNIGDVKTRGVAQLWDEDREALIERPLDVLTPMGGSFNFDPRGAWTAIDAGYSLNEHKHRVSASPVVEFMAAWGLENARPEEYETRRVRYAAWGVALPLMLARPALSGDIAHIPLRRFRFTLDLSGKNKVVTFADLEASR